MSKRTYLVQNGRVKLTKRVTLEITRDLFRWLADAKTQVANKLEYPDTNMWQFEAACACCEYVANSAKSHEGCGICPMLPVWPNGCEEGLYIQWRNAATMPRKKTFAAQIAQGAEKLLKEMGPRKTRKR